MIVYCFINTVNGKMYVGITDRTLEYRWNKHVISFEYHFHRAFELHGEEMFEGVVVEECQTLDELKAAERRWIWLLASNVPEHGYNMTLGGDGVFGLKFSDESRQKMSDSHKGKQLPEEQKRKISEAMKRRYADPVERQRTQESLLRPEIREKMLDRKLNEEIRKN